MRSAVPSRPAARLARWLPLLLLLLFAAEATAQVRVDISFKRKLYVKFEPIIASVTINNLSGRPLLLENADYHQWFGFNIETTDGRPIAPVNPNYSLAPAAVGPGEKLTRAVNLTPLFPLHDFGAYRVKAVVYVKAFNRAFSSPPLTIEITDGRPIWQEVVGVPGAGGQPELRTITLLSHKLSRTTRLYVRIENRETGQIYATRQLGQFLTFGRPEVMLDVNNEIHILQNSSPKQFLYSHIGLQGDVLGQQAYLETGVRPTLVKEEGGKVAVRGGRPYHPGEELEQEAAADRVGDRPVPMPGS